MGKMETVQEVGVAPPGFLALPLTQRELVQEGLTTVALVGIALGLLWLNKRLPHAPVNPPLPPEDV